MNKIILKCGRFLYRNLNISANQRIKRTYKGSIITADLANKYLEEIILSGEPKLVSRLGSPESQCVMNYIEIKQCESHHLISRINAEYMGCHNQWSESVKQRLYDLVGFYPTTNEMLRRFAKFYLEQLNQIDLMGIWGFVPGEGFLANHFCKNAIKYDPKALESYFFNEPWTRSLSGKKVLVIHPFEQSIINQYSKRKLLFSNKDVLPDFELLTVKAVQSIAGNQTPFINWFDALESMIKLIDEKEFDIALIGAGSYGLPLGSHIKGKGKVAIHIGGALQIMFGIKGRRWDDHHEISKLYNEHWIRPDASEIVERAKIVEDGCYW
jgi:hypothetical protein